MYRKKNLIRYVTLAFSLYFLTPTTANAQFLAFGKAVILNAMLSQASNAIDAQQNAKAVKLYTSVISQINPKSAYRHFLSRAYAGRALAYQRLGLWQNSLNDINEAIRRGRGEKYPACYKVRAINKKNLGDTSWQDDMRKYEQLK